MLLSFPPLFSFLFFFSLSPSFLPTKGERVDGDLHYYLKRFGYLSDGPAVAASVEGAAKGSPAAAAAAAASPRIHASPAQESSGYTQEIKWMQLYAGLNPTGELDRSTHNLLSSPRCGRPDIESSPRSRRGRRVKRFKLFPRTGKWGKTVSFCFDESLGPMAEWEKATILKAMKTWEKAAKLNYVEDESSCQMRIILGGGKHSEDENDNPFDGKSGVLGHAWPPVLRLNPGSGLAGDVHFDAEDWIEGGGRDFLLQSTALHELGHTLGLHHSVDAGAVMTPVYSGRLEPTLDDLKGLVAAGYEGVEMPEVEECPQTIDAASFVKTLNAIYFFRGGDYWVVVVEPTTTMTTTISRRRIQSLFGGIPVNGRIRSDAKVDAIFESPDGITVVHGDSYSLFEIANPQWRLLSTGATSALFAPRAISQIDAVVVVGDKIVVFFGFWFKICHVDRIDLCTVSRGVEELFGASASFLFPLSTAFLDHDGRLHLVKDAEEILVHDVDALFRASGSSSLSSTSPPRPLAATLEFVCSRKADEFALRVGIGSGVAASALILVGFLFISVLRRLQRATSQPNFEEWRRKQEERELEQEERELERQKNHVTTEVTSEDLYLNLRTGASSPAPPLPRKNTKDKITTTSAPVFSQRETPSTKTATTTTPVSKMTKVQMPVTSSPLLAKSNVAMTRVTAAPRATTAPHARAAPCATAAPHSTAAQLGTTTVLIPSPQTSRPSPSPADRPSTPVVIRAAPRTPLAVRTAPTTPGAIRSPLGTRQPVNAAPTTPVLRPRTNGATSQATWACVAAPEEMAARTRGAPPTSLPATPRKPSRPPRPDMTALQK